MASEHFSSTFAGEAFHAHGPHCEKWNFGPLPFTGRAFQSGLNERYWQVVDHAISEAARLGITCVIVPQYSGFQDGGDGWSLDVEAAYDADPQHLVRYGTELARRYTSYPNIVWMVGHDRVPTTKFKAASPLIALELQSGTNHMVIQGGWNDGGTASTGDTDWNGVAGPDISTDFDTVYVYDRSVAAETAAAWASKAAIFLEGVYEQEVPGPLPIGDQLLRAQMWEAFSTGASAAFFGNNPRWHFGSGGLGTAHSGNWQQSITSDPFNKGTVHAGYMADFMSTIEGALLTVPDTRSTFVTAGPAYGRLNQSLGVVYAGGARSITLDTTEFAGTGAVRIRRFDPTDGSSTGVTMSEAQASSRVVGYPGPNSAGGTDYVYVVDLAS